jgi:hypothetical protein
MGIPLGVTLLILIGLSFLGSALVVSVVLVLRTEFASGVGRRGPPTESSDVEHWTYDLSTDELYQELLKRRVVDDRFKIGIGHLMKEIPESHKSDPYHDDQDSEEQRRLPAPSDAEHGPPAPRDVGWSGTAPHAEAQTPKESVEAMPPPSFIGETGLGIVRERLCRFGWQLIQNMPMEYWREEGVW